MCYDSFSTTCECVFFIHYNDKKTKSFLLLVFACFLELESADNFASVLFAYFLLFFLSSLIFSKGYLPWEVSVILWKRMGVQFLLRFFVQSFLSFSRVVVGHRHRLMTLKGLGLGLHVARFHVAKCFWFLLPGCCCVSVMQVDVRYCLKPLMIGFALKWATSFAVFSIPL